MLFNGLAEELGTTSRDDSGDLGVPSPRSSVASAVSSEDNTLLVFGGFIEGDFFDLTTVIYRLPFHLPPPPWEVCLGPRDKLDIRISVYCSSSMV